MFDAYFFRDVMLDKTDEEIHHILSSLFPHKQLFDHSTGWRESENFIMKAKGANGDAIIGWVGVHDEGKIANGIFRSMDDSAL